MKTQAKWLWAAGILAVGVALLAFGVRTEYVLLLGFLLLCPGMMLFMGGGSGHDRSKKGGRTASETEGAQRNRE